MVVVFFISILMAFADGCETPLLVDAASAQRLEQAFKNQALRDYSQGVVSEQAESARERWYRAEIGLVRAHNLGTPRRLLVPLQEKYFGENIPWDKGRSKVVNYLRTDDERAPFRITIQNGRIYDHEGNPLDTRDCTHTVPRKFTEEPIDAAIFIMDENGEIYIHKHPNLGQWHHSSLAGGRPVAGAGELTVHDGYLVAITNHSGHYQVPRFLMEQVFTELKSKRVDMARVEKIFFSPPSAHLLRAQYLSWGFSSAVIEKQYYPQILSRSSIPSILGK